MHGPINVKFLSRFLTYAYSVKYIIYNGRKQQVQGWDLLISNPQQCLIMKTEDETILQLLSEQENEQEVRKLVDCLVRSVRGMGHEVFAEGKEFRH